MMTNFKLSSKKHVFIIIGVLIIAIGMAVGTIFHFLTGEFFNYGDEFADSKSITVTYRTAERNEQEIREICKNAFGEVTPYEVSFSEVSNGGEAVYKFSAQTDFVKLRAVAEAINVKLAENSGLSRAVVSYNVAEVGGAKVANYAAIAVGCAMAVQLIYFVFRYKYKAALAALAVNLHNVGLFYALLALTRLPVGINIVAFGALAAVISMIASGIFFDRVRKNAAEDESEKLTHGQVVDAAHSQSFKICVILACFLLVATAVLGIFAICAAPHATVLAPIAVALLSILTSAYGSLFFAPSVCAMFDVKSSKNNSKPVNAEAIDS